MTVAPDDPGLADEAHDWKSAYIHVPFCRRRCPYCDFAIVDESATSVDHRRYIDAVLAEIEMEDGIGPLDAINFGGGTPSRLATAMIGDVVDSLAQRFGRAKDAEISIEVNPEDWSNEYGAELVAHGVTRVSIGAQSFDGEILGVLGRLHGPPEIERCVESARDVGVRSVGIDLIFGHADESDHSWTRSIDRAFALEPDHVSTYALTVERGTALAASIEAGAQAPDPDTQADRYQAFLDTAAPRGLARYEVSNHAKSGHACRYNLATWAHAEYLGFGLAAHDHRWGTRARNHRRLDRYLEAVEAGTRPRIATETLSASEQERDRLMLGLRLAAGTPITSVAATFLASDGGARMAEHGLVWERDGRIGVTNLFLADAVAREALAVA